MTTHEHHVQQLAKRFLQAETLEDPSKAKKIIRKAKKHTKKLQRRHKGSQTFLQELKQNCIKKQDNFRWYNKKVWSPLKYKVTTYGFVNYKEGCLAQILVEGTHWEASLPRGFAASTRIPSYLFSIELKFKTFAVELTLLKGPEPTVYL